MGRIQNSTRNIFWEFFNKIVSLLFPFFIRTLMIKNLGAEYLGLNSLFASILQVLNLSELGFSTAVIYNLYRPVAENNTELVCNILNYYKKIYRNIGMVILIVGCMVIPFLPHFISSDYPSDINLYTLYLIYLANTAVSYFLFAYKNAIIQANQRKDVCSKIATSCNAVMYACQLVVLVFIKNYYTYVIFLPLFTIVNNLITGYAAKRFYPQYVCRGDLEEENKKEITTKVKGLMISKVCVTTRNSLDSIFLSMFLGLTAVAKYNNYYYIMTSIGGILSVLATSITASVGNSVAVESPEKNYQDMCNLNFIYMWLSGWCTVCLFCLYQPWMKIWVGEELMLPYRTMVLFCLYFFLLRMGDIKGVYLDAAGLWWETRYRAIVETVMNCVLNYYLARYWGINGILLATIISILLINYGYGTQIIFRFYFKQFSLTRFFLDNGLYFVVTIGACFVAAFLCDCVQFASGIIDLLAKGTLCCIVPNLCFLVFYHKNKYFAKSAIFFKRIVAIRRDRK